MRHLGLVAALAACGGGTPATVDAAIDVVTVDAAIVADAASCPAAIAPAHELTVAGETAVMGIFDPSLVYPAGASAGAMAYSSVPDQETIRTHLAVSSDQGATWTLAGEANQPEAATLPSSDATECPGGACSGKLISEVPSLIFDADEPDPNKRWKLFAHRYLVGAGVALHYRIGTIALQTAPAPNGPWTAPQKLLGWTSPAAYSSDGAAVNITTLPGSAQDCLALTEPGAVWLPGTIDLAVGCVYLDGGAAHIRVELLRSVDHAAHWTSLGTLVRASDLGCAPATDVNAPDLFAHDGVEYVAVTPSDSASYHGCLVFPIANGAIAATPTEIYAGTGFTGACSYAEQTGYAIDVGHFDQSVRFHIQRP